MAYTNDTIKIPLGIDVSIALNELYDTIENFVNMMYPKESLPDWVIIDKFYNHMKRHTHGNIYLGLLEYIYESEFKTDIFTKEVMLEINISAVILEDEIYYDRPTSQITLSRNIIEYIRYPILEWKKDPRDFLKLADQGLKDLLFVRD